MPGFRTDDEDDDSTFDEVSAMADRLGIKGEARFNYVNDHMTQLGYEPVQSRESYRRIQQEGEDDQAPASRWGFGKRSDPGQGSGQSRPPAGRRRDDDDSF